MSNLSGRILWGALVGTLLVTASASAAATATSLGRKIDDFSLQDFRGKAHHLRDYADSKLVAVVFLGTDCPLARLYGPRLQALADEYANRGVTFLGIDPNRQDSVTEMAHYARVYGVEFPFLRDGGNVVADQFGAVRVPEVFLLDQDRVIRYRGRIDDQYGLADGSSGYARADVRRRHLAVAMDELLEGKPVSVTATDATGCLIGRVRDADSSASITYSNQVARILQKHCVECHRPGQIAPFALEKYDEVAGWAEMIAEVVREQRMPPWHADPAHGTFINDRSMSKEEKETLFAWVEAGAPEGNPAELPEPMVYEEGWQLGEPDQIIATAKVPYAVPAEGYLEYQYFYADPGWTEDKWLKASECRFGERQVVHHMFVFAVPPGANIEPWEGPRSAKDFNPSSNGSQLIAGAAPGTPAWFYNDNIATYLEAGTKLVFQMHYTTCGREVSDISEIGMTFADPSEVKQNVRMTMAMNPGFKIPAGHSNYPVSATKEFKSDAMILTMAPHMHLRGKSFKYTLEYPDGTEEILLDVPRYDFNWQVIYMLAEPKYVPAGSKLHCLAHFDNSADNLYNPDPTTDVRWGDMTWEEMMIGWFAMTSDIDPEKIKGSNSRTARLVAEIEKKPPRVSGLTNKVASRALESPAKMDLFFNRLEQTAPQVDRVSVSVVDGDKVRVISASQSPVLNHALGLAGREFSAADSELAVIAQGGKTVVFDDIRASSGKDFAAMSKVVRSSMHVPITIDGKPATLDFFSKEPAAFPPSVTKLLEPFGALVSGKE